MSFYSRNNRAIRWMVCVGMALMIVLSALPFDQAYAEGATTSSLDTMDTFVYSEDSSLFANPERGWYRAYETDDIWSIDKLRGLGITMILLEANLKDYKTGPIADAKLTEIRNGFNLARKYGLQVMFRAAYDFDGVAQPDPTSLTVITGHIAQLKNIFYENEDILYCVQAGFLGPWGEWHNSYYGDPPSLQARKTVLFALMEAVPKSRSIQVRRPMFIRDIFASEPTGSSLSIATAYNQSNLARTGYHDDALLSSESESGTYVDSKYTRQAELNWTDNHNRYTPFVAESNKVSTYSDPNNAIFELNKLHAQIINIDYHPDVISKWKSTTYGSMSTYNYVTQRMGYRLILQDASINTGLVKGGALRLQLRIRNDGFGNLINDRNLEVVLSNGSQTYAAKVNDDPRQWFRENGVMTKDFYFSIPSGIGSGSWSIYLNLPNASASLAKNPLYSVRFANSGMWVAEKGYNLIKSGITFGEPTASGTVSSFEQITREAAERLIDMQDASAPVVTTAPTATPTASPVTTPESTATPEPTGTPVATVEPTATATPEATGTVAPTQTATPVPTASPDSVFEGTVSGVTASPASYNSIKVAWSALSGAEKYEVFRASSSSGTFSMIASTTSLSYTNRSVSTGSTYYYKVRAYRVVDGSRVYSTYSDTVSSAAKPSKPAPVRGTKLSSSRIKVTWGAVAGATKYELWRSTSSSGTYSLVATTGSAYFTNTGLRSGRTYYYKVRAYRTVGSRKVYGAFSPVVAARS